MEVDPTAAMPTASAASNEAMQNEESGLDYDNTNNNCSGDCKECNEMLEAFRVRICQ